MTTATATTTTGSDNKVIVGLNHGSEEPKNVLLAYLMGVEALRAGKEAILWLTNGGLDVAIDGGAAQIDVPGAPSIAALHEEFVTSGGIIYVCPVCVKLRDLGEATWSKGAEVKGAPSVYEFAAGGALVFNY